MKERVCIVCEGLGVIRFAINRDGDYIKRHCRHCDGTGKKVSEFIDLPENQQWRDKTRPTSRDQFS